ncbi:hypothetical protein KFE98_12435 [bacterium SCSIO 12741]|nr:hypothetical protein KFE98_12435 [bacterium SCSIO 12741]
MFPLLGNGQCTTTISSSNGYDVNVTITPQTIIPSSNSCPFGYNYNVEMSYSASFSGSNQPANLYTFQGNLICGASSHFFNLPNAGGSGNVTSSSNVWTGNTDCATSTVSSFGCNSVNIIIQGPGISHQTVNCAITPLPVDLVRWKAEKQGPWVTLKWSTASEQNNDRFELQRSQQGQDWETIDEQAGQESSNVLRHYQFEDQPYFSGPLFYRLKQVDLNGDTHYSSILMVEGAAESEQIHWSIKEEYIGLQDPNDKIERVIIRDLSGQALIRESDRLGSEIRIPRDGLKAGIYLLQWWVGDQVYTEKVYLP